MSALKKLYGEIAKTEELDDGTLKVWGYASSATEDSDGETITADAMKAALPDYMKFGAVREMHQPKAAGTAIEAEVQDDGMTKFCAHVVDSEAVKKVKTGVYKGFSIGGKVTKRDDLNKTVITGLKLVEVSLVDRPANPEAVITMYKAELAEPKQVWHCGNTAHVHISKAECVTCIEKGENTTDEPATDDATKSATTEKTVSQVDEGVPAGNGEAAATKSEEADDLKKGLWNVVDFARALQDLSYVCCSAEWDKQAEGDNSPIPAQLRAWIASGVEIFKSMAAEELDEMLRMLREQAGEPDVIALAAKADLIKAGARYSKSTKAELKKVHDKIIECDTALKSMGYADAEEDDDGDDSNKAAATDDLNKADSLQKSLDESNDKISKLESEKSELQKRITELEAMPAEGKGVLKVFEKGEDITGSGLQKIDPVKNSQGSDDPIATAIKAAQSQPIQLYR